MSTCTVKFISTIHKKNMLLVNEYEFMFSKNNFRKREKMCIGSVSKNVLLHFKQLLKTMNILKKNCVY